MITENANAIAIKNLVFGYQKHKPLIHISDWKVATQTQTFLYGPSGSGKSTLLNLLCGILSPQQGSIELLDRPFSQLRVRARDRFRARHIGVVFQEFNLIPFLTVWENIEVATHFSHKVTTRENSRERAREIFSRLRLNDALLEQRADSLSVGQRQRVSIARALINQPEILIADEPTSALDSDNRDEFIDMLLEVSEQSQCTVLFVSHDKELQSHFSHHHSIEELLSEPNHVA